MSDANYKPSRFSLRDFFNRREPGARWMLGLLVVLAAGELILLFGYEGDKPFGATPAYYIPPIVTLVALFTCRWWSPPSAPAFPDPRFEVPSAARRWVWLMAGAVAILSMWPRSVRIDHSLSLAETAQLDDAWRHSRENAPPAGDDKMGPSGGRRLVWGHVAAQFAVLNLDQIPLHKSPLDPRAARALPWAAGVLIPGLVVLLAAALGSPRAGLAAGLIAAMHPQLVQAGSEVADAALSQCFFGAALLCLINAMRTNSWRWWAALAAAQAAMCFGHPTMSVVVLGLNLIAAAVLGKSPASQRDKTSHALRLLVVTAIAASTLAVPFSYLPGFTPSATVADQWANSLSGVPFSIGHDLSGTGASLLSIISESAWRWPVLFVLLPLVIVAGVGFLLRQDWRTRLVGAAFILSLLYFGAPNGIAPTILLLPVVMAWAGAGLMRLFPKQPRLQHAPLFVAVLYVMATAPALQRTTTIPRQPLRDVIAAAGTGANASTTVATFGSGPTYLLSRDIRVIVLEKPDHLNSLIDTAFEKSLPLFVFHSLADRTDARFEPIARKLEASGQFVFIQEFPAFDPRENMRLYKYEAREQIIRLNVKPEKK